MIKRWILYLTAWVGCLIFYFAYGQWLGWVLLAAISILPVCSLVVSLPVMLSARLQVHVPKTVQQGVLMTLELSLRSFLPLPRWRVRIQAHHSPSGKNWLLTPGGDVPTEHCGMLQCTVSRGRIYDYFGLFCLRLKTPEPFRLQILPQAEKPEALPDVQRFLAYAWRPKPGGGYSENHELRLYRPGDSLRQIHWKLSGKTGKLILRQSMEPQGSVMLIWLRLKGSAPVLDRKLGQLLWISEYLLQEQIQHDLLAYTAEGLRRWHIGSSDALQQALRELMGCHCLQEEIVHTDTAPWQYYIGGDEDETS